MHGTKKEVLEFGIFHV